MEIVEYIYQFLVEPSNKNPTREYTNRDVHNKKMRGEASSLNTESNMSESADKRRNSYVDHHKDISNQTCLIHGPGHSSDE